MSGAAWGRGQVHFFLAFGQIVMATESSKTALAAFMSMTKVDGKKRKKEDEEKKKKEEEEQKKKEEEEQKKKKHPPTRKKREGNELTEQDRARAAEGPGVYAVMPDSSIRSFATNEIRCPKDLKPQIAKEVFKFIRQTCVVDMLTYLLQMGKVEAAKRNSTQVTDDDILLGMMHQGRLVFTVGEENYPLLGMSWTQQ